MSKNSVYIATSLDGYIADREGGLGWLEMVSDKEGDDMGYGAFMERIDALVMGRKTFETVRSFDGPWPYDKPVYVLSRSLDRLPRVDGAELRLLNGGLDHILETIHRAGHERLYIDGGATVQHFLREDRIDELIVTRFPIILGGGTALFDNTKRPLTFEHLDTKVYLGQLVQSHYARHTNEYN